MYSVHIEVWGMPGKMLNWCIDGIGCNHEVKPFSNRDRAIPGAKRPQTTPNFGRSPSAGHRAPADILAQLWDEWGRLPSRI